VEKPESEFAERSLRGKECFLQDNFPRFGFGFFFHCFSALAVSFTSLVSFSRSRTQLVMVPSLRVLRLKRGFRLLSLLLLLGTSAAFAFEGELLPECSSLDGPFCPMVNGQRSPFYSNGASRASPASPLRGIRQIKSSKVEIRSPDEIGPALRKVLQAVGVSGDEVDVFASEIENQLMQLKGQENTNAAGSFLLRGSLDERASEKGLILDLVFKPLEWLKNPGEAWVMLGLSGRIKAIADSSRLELRAALIDSRGKAVDGCSEIIATLEIPDGKMVSKKNELLDGKYTWNGAYTCFGLYTKAKITFGRTKESLKGSNEKLTQVSGEDVFAKFDLATGGAITQAESQAEAKSVDVSNRKRLTDAGCVCLENWSTSIVVDGVTTNIRVEGGICSNPGNVKERDYCMIVPDSCTGTPGSRTWDFCRDDWKEVLLSSNNNGMVKELQIEIDGFEFTEEQINLLAEFSEIVEDALNGGPALKDLEEIIKLSVEEMEEALRELEAQRIQSSSADDYFYYDEESDDFDDDEDDEEEVEKEM